MALSAWREEAALLWLLVRMQGLEGAGVRVEAMLARVSRAWGGDGEGAGGSLAGEMWGMGEVGAGLAFAVWGGRVRGRGWRMEQPEQEGMWR